MPRKASILTPYRQHLYRQHMQSFVCQRCDEKFKTQSEFDIHIEVSSTCPSHEAIVIPGITKSQELRLKTRKRRSSTCTEEDKWNTMIEILFPDENLGEQAPVGEFSRTIHLNALIDVIEVEDESEASNSNSACQIYPTCIDTKLLQRYENFMGDYMENLLLDAIKGEMQSSKPLELQVASLAIGVAGRISNKRRELLAKFERQYRHHS